MNKTKRETLIFHGLGFPIRLIDVPMKKVFGEWALDINFNHLQKAVLHSLVKKPTHLTGREARFIRHYLEMSTREFAKLFDVSHVAILKWENEKSKMSAATEVCIRLFVLNYLKVSDKEFRKLYLMLNPEKLANFDEETLPLEFDANDDLIAC